MVVQTERLVSDYQQGHPDSRVALKSINLSTNVQGVAMKLLE
jgi:hypothetical protein